MNGSSGTSALSRFLHGETRLGRAVAALAVAAALLGFVWWSFVRTGISLDPSSLWEFRHRFWTGFEATVVISAASLVVSLIIGVLTAMARRSSIVFLNYLATAYVQLIRGTPLLVQIYFFYYLIGTAWGLDNRYVAGVVILSLFEGAYIAEIVRGGWQSIAPQTFEVAKAVALSPWQTFRLVTWPILLARTVPALAGQFASIIKDSSLLSVIAVIELTQTTQEISAENFQMFENYLFLGVLYFILTFAVSLASHWLEGRIGRAFGTQ